MHCVDRHRFHADPDPTFHFDADPDPDPPQVLHMLENQIYFLLPFTAVGVYLFYLYHKRNRCNNFQYVGQYIEIFWKEI